MKTKIWSFLCWVWNPFLPGIAAIFGLIHFIKLAQESDQTDNIKVFISACSLIAGPFLCWAGVQLIQSLILKQVGHPDLFKTVPDATVGHVEFYGSDQ